MSDCQKRLPKEVDMGYGMFEVCSKQIFSFQERIDTRPSHGNWDGFFIIALNQTKTSNVTGVGDYPLIILIYSIS